MIGVLPPTEPYHSHELLSELLDFPLVQGTQRFNLLLLYQVIKLLLVS